MRTRGSRLALFQETSIYRFIQVIGLLSFHRWGVDTQLQIELLNIIVTYSHRVSKIHHVFGRNLR